jgi:serine/threonine protein kinase
LLAIQRLFNPSEMRFFWADVLMIRAGRMVGAQIGNYRVIGPAVPWPLVDVYVGQDTRTDQVVDLVVLPPEVAASAGGVDQFITEMRAILAFRHPGFVQVLDCDRLNDSVYLAMEHVEAECLSERLKRDGGLVSDLAAVREVVGQTAAALEAAHKAGLLYLCLRPEHMLLVPASQPALPVTVRLLELGLGSRFLSSIRQMAPGKELPASMLRYCPPEQCSGSGVDHRSDIYALGCVFFELLVGQPPFRETDLWDLVAAHAHQVPARIRELRPGLPAALDDLVATMLEKDPAQRPFSMEEILAVLRASVSEPAAILAPAQAPPSAATQKTRILERGLPVPKPADDVPFTPLFRPTRLLTPDEEALVPRRPAAVASPHRVRRDPLPAPVANALTRRRSRPSKGKRGTVKVHQVSHTGIVVGVALACFVLGAGLFLWLLRPPANQAQHTPTEETPAREPPIPPPVAPSPAPAAIATPTPASQPTAAGPAQPKLGPAGKHPFNLGEHRVPNRGKEVLAPAIPLFPQSAEGILKPTYKRR